MTHTPTPWHSVENSWAITSIYDADKQKLVCEFNMGEPTEEDFPEYEATQKENAALIVHRVNNWDKLVEALEIAERHMKIEEALFPSDPAEDSALGIVQSALASARDETK